MDVKTDPACALAYQSTLLERVINALNTVIIHGDQEARAELGARSSSIEESWASMSVETFRHEVVCLDRALNVAPMDADGYSHDHVLRTFCNLAIYPEKVRPL